MADSSFAVLNLGSQRVSAAVFNKGRNGELILKAFDVAEMHGDPSSEATRLPQLRVALVELTEKLKLKGKTVYYAIAGHVVFTRFVKLPPIPDESKADQIVEFEARQNVPFPINEVIWDYEFIGPKEGFEREVALVAIKADALNDINDQVESVGLKVAAVDLAPLAVFNAFRYTYPDVDETTLIIDLGARSTNLIFVEGERVFTRNILVGGSTVTGNVAKELGMNFAEAEDQKRARGYVAPGGAYEANDDEIVEAMSKIMRNTMTRLHGEIVRTVNYYRSQQGGSPPRRFFLCGGGAQTPLVVDFFQEKFNLPVEVLNPLRGVQSSGVSQDHADANAPGMMEVIGLGLRHIGACPVEVELLPDTVAASRDAAKRLPLLVVATLCLFALLGLAGFYFTHATSVIESKLVDSRNKSAELKKHDAEIKDWDKQLQLLKGQSGQLEQAINDRDYWKGVLAQLNNKFETDFVWITQLEVLKNGSSVTPALTAAPGGAAPRAATPVPAAVDPNAPPPELPYSMRVQGLYRKNDEGGQQVVYKYYDSLKKDTALFGPVPPEQKPDVDSGIDDERYAYQFKFRLPLVNGMKFEK